MRLPFCYPRYFFVAVLLLGLVVILPTIIHLHFEIDPYLAGSNPIHFFDPERDDLLDEDPSQSTDSTTLDLFEQDAGEGLKESEENVDQNSDSRDTMNGVKDAQSDNDGKTGIHENNVTIATTEEMSGLSDQGTLQEDNERLYTPSGTKEKIWEMEDQLIMAKAYLAFVPKASNTHLRLELKLRTRDIEKALSQANKSSDFSMSALQIIRAMEATLSKANRAYPDCSERAYKIRASLEKKEEELRTVQNELLNLVRVASTALPKGIQCLSLRLTLEYFTSNPEDHKLPDRHKVQKPYLHHYAVFSGNVLACAVVVNSTISSSQEPEKIVFHVVTDSLNFPAMTMWFLLNPPTPATIDILIWDNYEQLAGNFSPTDELVGIRDPAYTSTVNHLQFFLPNHFPFLHKILVLDHDVVVQRDLSWLWRIDMEGKVICAVKMCNHQLEELLDFTDPILSSSFDPQACVLAFGMNLFDLNEWRKRGLTTRYGNWLQKGIARRIQTGEGWPLAQLVFYNHTAYLDPGWHVLGLGNDMNVRKEEIKKAAVIHYSGTRKPWLDSAIREYKNYWDKYLNYNNPSLQKCHVHNN